VIVGKRKGKKNPFCGGQYEVDGLEERQAHLANTDNAGLASFDILHEEDIG